MPAKKKQQASRRAPNAFWRTAAQIAALWIAAFLAYSNSFDAGLVFDNAAIIGHDPRIRAATAENVGLIFNKEYWYPATNSGLYRPLATLSYLFNDGILGDGTNPPGYHAINLALHLVNVALVYALGLAIFEGTAPSFAMAALWSVHPLLTESVTNIVGRADLLSGFAVLAGLLCHIRAAAAARRRRVAWLVGLGCAQAIGIFSKESAAVLPGMMALYDFVFARRQWRERLINYGVLAIPFAAFFYLRSQVDTHMVTLAAVNPLVDAGFFTARATAIKVIGKLLWLFFWPARLSADYSYEAVPLFRWNPFDWGSLQAALACAALIALAIRFRERKTFFFFVAFFFIALAPTSNLLFPIGAILAERFMYLPAIALCGCIVIAVEALWLRPWMKWSALAGICLAFGMRTYARNLDWRDELSLWSSTVEAYPECARAHYNLGQAWVSRAEYANAAVEYDAALRIRPDYPHAHLSLGTALEKFPSRLPEAIQQYRSAVQQDPAFAEAHYDLGDALARSGKLDEAIAELLTAVRIQPDLAEAHNDLGAIYASDAHRSADAIKEYQIALHARPDYVQAHIGLGGVYLATNRLDDAITEYREAARLGADLGEPHYRLGMALLQAGRASEALPELETALRIHPDPQGQRMVDELRARLR